MFPVVLCHGYGRPNLLWSKILKAEDKRIFDSIHYFRNTRKALEKEGFSVYHSSVAWVGSVEARARKLRSNIVRILGKSGAEKVHIIGHSMGGLDARRMIFMYRDTPEKIHHRIASISTIGTPHSGSSVADLFSLFFGLPLWITTKLTPLNLDGVNSLTTRECTSYNESEDVIKFEMDCGIPFFSYSGGASFFTSPSFFALTYLYVKRKEKKRGDPSRGANDGVVSRSAAEWRGSGTHAGHFDDLGHSFQMCWYSPGRLLAGEGPRKFTRRAHGVYIEIAKRADERAVSLAKEGEEEEGE